MQLKEYKVNSNDDINTIIYKHKNLVRFLIECNISYYEKESPIVDDFMYDELIKYLEFIENKYSLSSIITKTVGSSLSQDKNKSFEQIKHTKPMMSLSNIFSFDELKSFDEKIKRFLSLSNEVNIEYFSELKIDGVSLSLRYEQGILSQALTRGDGIFGENVKSNVETIEDIPKTLYGNYPEVLEVRGEVYINKNDFISLNKKLSEKSKKIFANARNLTSGSLRVLDSNITAQRPLKFLAWGFGEISSSFHSKIKDFSDIYNLLQNLQFKVNILNKKCKNIYELYYHYLQIQDDRHNLDFDIDGMVYKVNSLDLQDRLGNLIKSPRWAVAHKFDAQKAITIVEDITFQIGRTGVVTPVAELKPINIGGVLVSRSSLYNFDDLKRKDIRIGDSVVIQRAGDVIPQVIEVLFDKRSQDAKEIIIPEICPICSSPLERDESEVALRCTGGIFVCKAMLIGGLTHFVSKGSFDIEGLAQKQISFFNKIGILNYPHEIFELKNHRDMLVKLDNFGEKSIDNLIASIDRKKTINLDKFIYSLGIRQVGTKGAKILAKQFKSIFNLIDFFNNKQEDININGFGTHINKNLYDYFNSEVNSNIIKKLLNYITIIDYTEENIAPNSSILYQKTILFTGKLSNISRIEAKNKAERAGAVVASSVTNKLDYLVIGDSPGGKLKKAQDLGIKVISEEEFLQLLNI